MYGFKAACGACVALGLICGIASPSQAGLLQLTVSDSLGNTLTVIDGLVGDQNIAANAINIDEVLLLSTFGALDGGSAVNASSNFATGELFRRIVQASTLIRDDIVGVLNVTYTIVATQTDFLNPPGPDRILTETSSGSFNNAPTNNTVSFQGGIDTGNGLGVISTSPGVLGPINSSSVFPNSFGLSGGPTGFSDPDFYSITARSVITTTENAEILVTNATRVDAVEGQDEPQVPAPASLALLAVGGLGLVGGSAKRRLRKA